MTFGCSSKPRKLPGSPLTHRQHSRQHQRLADVRWKGCNENTTASQARWNPAALTAGDSSPWIYSFHDTEMMINQLVPIRLFENAGLQRVLKNTDIYIFFFLLFLFSWWPQWIGQADFVKRLQPPPHLTLASFEVWICWRSASQSFHTPPHTQI